MYFIKTLLKDIFNDLFFILLFCILELVAWLMFMGLSREFISNQAYYSMHSTMLSMGLNRLNIEVLPIKEKPDTAEDIMNSSDTLKIDRDLVLSFMKTLDTAGLVLHYDSFEIGQPYTLFISAGLYTNLVEDFESEHITAWASHNLREAFSDKAGLASLTLESIEFTKQDLQIFSPKGVMSTQNQEAWLWINYPTIDSLLKSGLSIKPFQLIEGLVFGNYDSVEFKNLQRSVNEGNISLEIKKFSEESEYVGAGGFSYNMLVFTLAVILSTFVYNSYLASVVRRKYYDYMIHYFWGMGRLLVFFRILIFLVLANLIPILYILRLLNYNPLMSSLALVFYFLAIFVLSLYLYRAFVHKSQINGEFSTYVD